MVAGAEPPQDVGRRTTASILHVDMDAFYASVEILNDPSLRGRPVIVGGDGARGVVASCSYEARYYGVRSAMPSARAKRLCPHAVFLDGHFDLYEEFSARMHAVFASFTPLVEGLSLDEAFLDVAGAQRLFGPPLEIGHSLRDRLLADLGLAASVGVATTKHVAKLASVAAKPRASKSGPVGGAGVVLVEDGEVFNFLHPLPVRAIWGVGPRAAERLERLGIATVGDIARTSVEQLQLTMGDASGRHLYDLAWNRDPRPVVPARPAKSVGHEQTYATDLRERDNVHHQLVRLADAVTARLRKNSLIGRTLTVKVRFGNFETITRSRTLPKATANGPTFVQLADELTESVDIGRGVRLLGLSVANLEDAAPVEQLSMGEAVQGDAEERVLDDTVDLIRRRYGDDALVPGPLIQRGRPDLLRRGERPWGPGQEPDRPEKG